jgi:Fe-S oxidoreductase
LKNPLFNSFLRWDKTGGLLQGAEKCNGSADCRKNMVMGGAMCPSFMATRNEADSTRARANLLRLYLTGQLAATDKGLRDVKEILDLCLMCKACKAECPSNIDVAKLKMEFMQHYGDKVGFALRDFVFANQPVISKIASSLPIFFNGLIQSSMIRFILDKWLGISAKTHLPRYAHETLMHYNEKRHFNEDGKPIVWLFADEFTSYNNVSLGITTILLLERLGYNVRIPQHIESGRTYLSKGMLRKAKRVANRNVQLLSDLVNNNAPLIGVEPSAILTLRDEYPDLVDDVFALPANSLAENTFTIEEFLWKEMKDGRISQSQFTDEPRTIHFHGHCYQKALSDTNYTKLILSFPKNYNVLEIKSGCCGMAGSFGLEKEHVSLSVKIGEMALFPHVRSHATSSDIVVSGISCKHHVENNTGCSTSHPVEILYKALILK